MQLNTELQEIVGTISQLHKWKNTMQQVDKTLNFVNGDDHQVVEELIGLALNQSCAWVSVQ